MGEPLSKLVVGMRPDLDWALQEWAALAPDARLVPVEISHDDSYCFDFTPLAAYKPAEATGFVAINDRFLNLRRREVFEEMKRLGFSLPPLVSPHAIIAANVSILENVWIRAGAIICPDVRIGRNVHIGTGVDIQSGCIVEDHVMLRENTSLGLHCKLGACTTVGPHVALSDGSEAGAFCRFTKPGVLRGKFADGIFLEEPFEASILS